MTPNETSTYYEILDITPNATPQEVRDAYIRGKATYNKDSLALYSIVSTEEREQALKKIEEAYLVLSNPEKRREYDQNFELMTYFENPFAPQNDRNEEKSFLDDIVVSNDPTSPMDDLHSNEDLLIAPTTAFEHREHREPQLGQHGDEPSKKHLHLVSETEPQLDPQSQSNTQSIPGSPMIVSAEFAGARGVPIQGPMINSSSPPPRVPRLGTDLRLEMPALGPELLQEIENELDWKGGFLKKIRDSYKISIEEMATITKITKSYLLAIEDENFSKLPAPVYVRGFVTQMAKLLKLPSEKVATAYLKRLNSSKSK